MIALAGALALGGCTTGRGYGGFGLGTGYYPDSYYGGNYINGYYGDGYFPGGYYNGWYNDFYYPGSGVYVYDRGGRRHRWSDDQLRHWQGHGRPDRGHGWNGSHNGGGNHDGRPGGWNGGSHHGGRPGGWNGGGHHADPSVRNLPRTRGGYTIHRPNGSSVRVPGTGRRGH